MSNEILNPDDQLLRTPGVRNDFNLQLRTPGVREVGAWDFLIWDFKLQSSKYYFFCILPIYYNIIAIRLISL